MLERHSSTAKSGPRSDGTTEGGEADGRSHPHRFPRRGEVVIDDGSRGRVEKPPELRLASAVDHQSDFTAMRVQNAITRRDRALEKRRDGVDHRHACR